MQGSADDLTCFLCYYDKIEDKKEKKV